MEDVRRVATARGRAQVGAFLVEGRRMLERALRAGWAPRDVLVGTSARSEMAELSPLLEQVVERGGRWQEAPDDALLALSEGRRAGLIAALVPLPLGAALFHVVEAAPEKAVYLVIVDVVEPGNVGALVRTALASNAAAAICVGSTDPFHPKAVRTSLGSLFKLPLQDRKLFIQELD